jgi:hypothetical protein
MKMTYLPILLAMTVGGCIDASNGSSSSTTTTTTPPTTYPLAQAVQTLQATGFPAVSGTVSGTATTNGTPVAVTGNYTVLDLASSAGGTFAGAAALQQSSSIQVGVGTSPTINLGSTTISFFTTTGTPLGETSTGQYCVASSSIPYPATVTVGATGNVTVYNCYTDSTMTTPTGTATTGYAISAAAASTTGSTSSTTTPANATYTAVNAVQNTQNQLVAQYQISFEITSTGNLTFQSLAINQNLDGVLYEVTSNATTP